MNYFTNWIVSIETPHKLPPHEVNCITDNEITPSSASSFDQTRKEEWCSRHGNSKTKETELMNLTIYVHFCFCGFSHNKHQILHVCCQLMLGPHELLFSTLTPCNAQVFKPFIWWSFNFHVSQLVEVVTEADDTAARRKLVDTSSLPLKTTAPRGLSQAVKLSLTIASYMPDFSGLLSGCTDSLIPIYKPILRQLPSLCRSHSKPAIILLCSNEIDCPMVRTELGKRAFMFSAPTASSH